jgi:hypothetical protein
MLEGQSLHRLSRPPLAVVFICPHGNYAGWLAWNTAAPLGLEQSRPAAGVCYAPLTWLMMHASVVTSLLQAAQLRCSASRPWRAW